MASITDYPIKRVKLRKGDIRQNQGGGGHKVFQEVTSELRNAFSEKVRDIQRELSPHFKKSIVPAVAKVDLKGDALAKSHRPTNLFSSKTCPIIGGGTARQLYIEVTKEGLEELDNKIMNGTSKQIIANISTLNNLDLYSIEPSKGLISTNIPQIIKVKLFKFQDEKTNFIVEEQFRNFLEKKQIEILKQLDYGDKNTVYKLEVSNDKQILELKKFTAIRSLSTFAPVHTYTPDSKHKQPAELEPIMPDMEREYPIVAVVDSGISIENKYLNPWVENRENYVLPDESNPKHGTFVGGLIVYGDELIGKKTSFDGVKLIDICAVPNTDDDYGEVGILSEDDLIEILKEVVPRYRDKVKVWNLSLGIDGICDDEVISDFAASLDKIQEENNVVFIISAGNYEQEPIRTWPPEDKVQYDDKITIPADSVRGITVGSISHEKSSISDIDTPSPFSRKGPGPSYITKPEVVYYGGNVEVVPEIYKKGITSFNVDGSLIKDIGTSFSTPLISSLLAKIFHYFDNNLTVNLAKALLFHSALGSSSNDELFKGFKEYSGYGKPQELNKIISCTKSSSTIVIEGKIFPTTYIEVSDFPFPEVLKENGKWIGEVYITLVYNPPLDQNYGYEYCRSNIEVSLGTVKPNGKYSREINYEKINPYGYEEDLVKEGMKWSPIKMYKRKISNGINDNPWKLRLDLQGRSEEVLEPQDFALIITVRDPEGTKEVYNDVSSQIDQRFVSENLNVNTVRIRS